MEKKVARECHVKRTWANGTTRRKVTHNKDFYPEKMQPGTSKGQSIHINPVFKDKVLQKIQNNGEKPVPSSNAHINPLFIKSSIYMNPEFLNAKFKQDNSDSNEVKPLDSEASQKLPKITQLNKIISKSRTRIIRESHPQSIIKTNVSPAKTTSPILLLTKRKLVRAATNTLSNTTTVHKEIVKRKLKYKFVNKVHTLERTSGILKRRPKAFVGRYALRRAGSISEICTAPFSVKSKQKGTTLAHSQNKRLRFININGILYKSLNNKLQRRVEKPSSPLLGVQLSTAASKSVGNATKTVLQSSKTTKGRTVYVRGAKFVLDPKGFKLTRVSPATIINPTEHNLTISPKKLNTTSASINRNQSRRIDIGGLTYIASKQSNNVYVRTTTHLALAHLNQAKQRSVFVLSRCLQKTNKPCIIFQRLGKCAAFERNRCSKIHDRQQVTVCSKFLKGLCKNSDCLLSHNKTLQKMPVCKFFLQGSCVRTDCPYLHKKLSESSEICENFRRGFCALAEQCNKQHIFPGAKTKKCQLNATEFSSQQHLQKEDSSSLNEESALTSRYFNGNSFVLGMDIDSDEDTANCNQSQKIESKKVSSSESDDDCSENISTNRMRRKPLGTLPSFIPLS